MVGDFNTLSEMGLQVKGVGVVWGCQGYGDAVGIPRHVHVQGGLFLITSLWGFNFYFELGSKF